MDPPRRQVSLAGSTLHPSCHACAFFNDREEEYRVLLPFSGEGLRQGDKIFQIVEAGHRAERLQRLAGLGVDVPAAEQSGQIEVRRWEDAQLRDRRFDQFAMLDLVAEVLGTAKNNFPLTRFWANMEWALSDFPGVEDIVEYESRLNHMLTKFDDVVVCAYDLKKFSAAVVVDVLRTHPQVIIGGTLQENPFYIVPERFLAELQARRTPAG